MQKSLETLRSLMAQENISAVYIPSGDFHGSEYTCAHCRTRAHFSGFTGSAGSLLVLPSWAGLWTDARYHLQAEQALHDSGITLFRQGLPKVASLEDTILERLPCGASLAFDGRCVSAKTGRALARKLKEKQIKLRADLDLAGSAWENRPPLSAAAAWLLDICYAGESRAEKLARCRAAMQKEGTDTLLVASLEEIAWLLNLRGGDIDATPVALCYLALQAQSATLFINSAICTEEIRTALAADGVILAPYEAFFDYPATLSSEHTVSLDGRSLSYRLRSGIAASVPVRDCPSPIEGMKAVKNEIEIANMRKAHIKDAVAMVKFFHWLEGALKTESITELDAAARLEDYRRENEGYLGASFAPIVAYGAHGAIVHYSASEKTNVPLARDGFLLIDSGGHYYEGTSDCTRTLALGTLNSTQKLHYTTVLRGHLQLSHTQFLAGCTGANLDLAARAPLWDLQLDYKHGTGHGVGYLLSVHEGPQQIRSGASGGAVFQPGMITSNEPGLYLAGQYGIRLENLLLCVLRGETDFGQFLGFEPLTLLPFERRAIDATLLSERERAWLNAYHQLVYDTLAPHLNHTLRAFLSEQCAAL